MTMKLLSPLARLAIAFWTGAVAGVSFVVAPRVFGFLADRAQAGELMGPIFRKVDVFGIVAAVLFAIVARRSPWRLVLACLLGAAAVTNAFVLAPRILTGDLRLHGVSEWLWGGILVGGSVLTIAGPPDPPPHRLRETIAASAAM